MNLTITKNTCRICLLSNKKIQKIFSISNYDDYNGLRLDFKQKLEIHCGIEIVENDGLPSNICIDCISRINSAHDLWKQCQITDKKLKKFYNRTTEKIVNCVILKNKLCQTGDSLAVEVIDHNEENKLYHTKTLSSLKKSIALNKLPCNKNYSEDKLNNEKINNINESKIKYKQKSNDSINLNTNKTIDNKDLSESVNSSYPTKKLAFESILSDNVCEKIGLQVQDNPLKNLDNIIYLPTNDGNENEHINIDNKSGEFTINYIIENDHCYTTVVKKTLRKSQSSSLNNDDSVNILDKSIKSTNIKQNKCYICGKVYIKKAALYKHMKHHRKLFREKGFECQICKKKLGSNASLKLHYITHQEEKPYKCKYCGRGFLTESKRVYHERSHTLERPYVCDLCDATYPQMHLLKLHITKHTGENKYLCEKCGKSFRMYKCLREHQFTHTKEKPFICSNNCGMAYSNSGSLFAHKKRCNIKTQPLIS